ncbi:hypothetical protein PoB_004442700 [Plakobranchus ocellatus]|uniref:Uncharacterized protein n=1 Tax=Plakobranchus ocellatus TaxID=259542 RepID=A0AAV4BFA6_9GAST|nr:hypothetical protein PoB_004442700 [Plakobranchus ocellatus]
MLRNVMSVKRPFPISSSGIRELGNSWLGAELSDNEAWVATVSQPEKTTCGGAVPELLGTALTLRLEGDPASRGRPYVKRQTYAPRETLRPEGDPTSRETQRPEEDPTSRGRPKVDFEVPWIFPLKPCVRRL